MIDSDVSDRYWYDGTHLEDVPELNIVKVVAGTRLDIPRCATDYFNIHIGSTLLLSNGTVAVITNHFCAKDGVSEIVCTPVVAIYDALHTSAPASTGEIRLSPYGYGSDCWVVKVLYSVEPKVIFSELP